MKHKKVIILIAVIILVGVCVSCENPFMMGVAGDYVYNIEDFGRGAYINVINTTGANLYDVLEYDIEGDGSNYLINVTGNAYINEQVGLSSQNSIISIRGDGGNIFCNIEDSLLKIQGSATLILRNITIKSENPGLASLLDISESGTVIMETGAHLTGYGLAAVYVSDGTFMMNGGTIYNFKSDHYSSSEIVAIYTDSRFEKNKGAIIYGIDAPVGLRNIPNSSLGYHVVGVWGIFGKHCFRNTTMGARESLSITLDELGSIANHSGNWSWSPF
ncbi:MAG: hypothetical protein FWD28_02420 [Treponema sp.]|nr:hypothetical protein [Treponema sp.]